MTDCEEIQIVSENLGDRVRTLRKRQGLSQTALALMVDLNRSHLSEIENGSGNPSLSTLIKLSAGFDIAISELTDGIDPASPKPGISYAVVKASRRDDE